MSSLGTVADETQFLAVFGDHLYRLRRPEGNWDNVEQLERASLSEPEVGFELLFETPVPHYFTVADDFVYATGRFDIGGRKNDSCIVRYRLSDGATEPLIVLQTGLFPSNIAVDDAHVYWVDYDEPFGRGTSRLMRAPR